METCKSMGFTLENTPGILGIRSRAMGMRGIEVDFEAVEKGEGKSDVKPRVNRGGVDFDIASHYARTECISNELGSVQGQPDEFIQLDVGKARDFETINYNHTLHRKLRRAIDYAESEQEILERRRAVEHCAEKDFNAPATLHTGTRPICTKGQRILESGFLETAKQERGRARMELAEFNIQMRVLCRQAEEAALYAGLHKYAEVTGRISRVQCIARLQ